MREKVLSYLEEYKMVSENDHVIAGVSGGADSVCLFRVLLELKEKMGFTLSVVHVEHGIRGEDSLRDGEFVKNLAREFGVESVLVHCCVPQEAAKRGISTEEAARILRYEIFEGQAVLREREYGLQSSQVHSAVAHHREDLAETMVFHLCRGSGIDGLCGIPPVRGRIIRPLLCVTRREIETYLIGRRQVFCTDDTNQDREYSRNFIRHEILPKLCEVNKGALKHMWEFSRELSEASGYLKEETNRVFSESVRQGEGAVFCDVEKLFQNPYVIVKRVLKKALEEAAGSSKDIAREHVEELLDLAEGGVGRKASLPYGMEGVKTYGEIAIRKGRKECPGEGLVFGVLEENLARGEAGAIIATPKGKIFCRIREFSKKDAEIPKNKYTKWLDYDKIKNVLLFRTRRRGDFFILDGKGHRKYLKDYFINEKVPREFRDEIVLAAEGSHILWAVGYRISEEYKVTKDTREILELRFTEE
ncbi:MAG: tRNA lysidine(34) synthetase TilS [Lachnospiraceae bacterium]|nr:tRNA lysidine(34) synthetase TilS [Lachnospiraceae bacterium]